MKNTIVGLLVLTIIGIIGFVIIGTDQEVGQKPAPQPDTPAQLAITQISEQQITLSNNTVISIDDFADMILVATSTTFGSSDRIKEANVSPDGKHLAIAIGGAAHDFGWIYDVGVKILRPVVFQYGGGVALAPWKSATQATFVVTTPEPATVEKVVDITNLPEYPKVQ